MKGIIKPILAITIASTISTNAIAQQDNNAYEPQLYCQATVGAGIMHTSKKECEVPITLNATAAIGLENYTDLGVGIGVSAYQEATIPVYITARKYLIWRPNATLFAEANLGYGFAGNHRLDNNYRLDMYGRIDDIKGGLYLSPCIGTTLWKLYLSVGVEFQRLARWENDGQKHKYNNFCTMIKIGKIIVL